MKAPLSWIKDYVDINVDTEEFVKQMGMTGNAVEGVIDAGNGMHGVLVGKIEKIEKHPDADKLLICQVNIGKETVQIVTGASNVFEGAYIPVATDGSLLPTGQEIKRGKLRGVPSFGMMCSGEELNLTEEDYPGAGVYGILILQGEPEPGSDIRDIVGLNETVIDFEVGANRPDCLSILGIAKEASATLQQPIRIPSDKVEKETGDISEYVKVDVVAEDLCPRYIARALKNVKIGPSPKWMQERLRAAGVRSINNIVDITNFVMLETGQPMHAFDADFLRGSHIIVRRAEDGEKIVTLDEKERDLDSSMLLITDEGGPIGVAGVMGALNSEIKDDTKTVVFESAKFTYANIRKTAKALGLATEASMRFSKGVDEDNCEYAINRACALAEMMGAGEVVGGMIDTRKVRPEKKVIVTTAEKINGRLGMDIPEDAIVSYLERVFIEVKRENGNLICTIPFFRGDIEGSADLSEEVIRIHGYDNIPMGRVTGSIMDSLPTAREQFNDAIKDTLVANGYYENITYSFTSEAAFDKLCLPADHTLRKAIRILNPLGDDYAYVATTLIPSMLTTVATNLNRKSGALHLFEMSRVFLPKALPLTELPDEKQTLIIAVTGGDFFELKGIVEKVLASVRAVGEDVAAGGECYFHPGRKAQLFLKGEAAGEFGQIHPDVAENFGIHEPVYIAQINLDVLYGHRKQKLSFTQIPKYPAAERDLAFIVPKDTEARSLVRIIKKNGGKYLENVELFDIFEGAQLGEGLKSMAYSLRFRSMEGTLSDEQVGPAIDKIIAAAEAELGAKLRS
ncbi:MAG: phenylalanine--tRNA ligase subunit beta [Clostridiales bacterium]|nr:phenylalanine--tRNA ligase subunit beta [Clostridiales bacterium]